LHHRWRRLLSANGQAGIYDRNEGAKLPDALCRLAADSTSEGGNYCRSTVQLTDAQSQGTKAASTVARDGKTEGISRLLQ